VVTATFNLIPCYTLTVGTAGTGTGTVGVSPKKDCYPNGTVVTLTEKPAAGSTFAGWSGAASGDAASVKITISGDTTVTATFNLTTPYNPDEFPTDLSTGDYKITALASMDALTCGCPDDCITVPGFTILPSTTEGTYSLTSLNLATFEQEVENAFNKAMAAVNETGCTQTVSYSPVIDNAFTVTYTLNCDDGSGCTGGTVTILLTVEMQ
jgi:hypothetical protein